VIKEKSWIAFQRVEDRAIGKNPRGAHQVARPIAAAFDVPRIEQDQVFSGFGARMVAVGGMEIADVRRWVTERRVTNGPADVETRCCGIAQLNPRGLKAGHWEIAGQTNS